MKSAALITVYRILNPIVLGLGRVGIRPNMITGFSLLMTVVGALFLGTGHAVYALLFLGIGGLCDVLDGHLARTTNQETKSGAFFDSFVDRISDGAILLGFAMYGTQHSATLVALSALSILAAFAVSYARARGLSLGVDVTAGPMKRPQRFLFLMALVVGGFGAGIQALEAGMALFLLLTTVTAFARASLTMRELQSH